MAGQGLFLRSINLVQRNRFLLTNRSVQIISCQNAGLKQDVTQKLKDLKIPEKPKRPLSAYFKFVQNRRQEIINENPNIKVTEITKKCAEEWKNISPALKERYEREYKSELEVFAKESLEYKAKLTDEQLEALEEYRKEAKEDKEKRKKRKSIKAENKPKRPVTGFVLFIMDRAKQQGTKSNYVGLMKSLKGEWANMPEEQKNQYNARAKSALENYEIELLEWEKKMIQKGKTELVRTKTLGSKKVGKKQRPE